MHLVTKNKTMSATPELQIIDRPPEHPQMIGNLALQREVQLQPSEYRLFTNPYERIQYMHFTDDLIATIDGSVEHQPAPYDAVVYLDSSARPVRWMVNGLWEYVAKRDEQGQPVKQPPTFFANIDARRTSKTLTADRTQDLHDAFPGLATMNEAAEADDTRVLVVDEIAVSGDTLTVACDQLKAAFPNLSFKDYAWKDERGVPNQGRDNVRWYERGNDRYRAVIDSSEMSDQQRAALEQKGLPLNKPWLSVPNPDRAGANIVKQEVAQMIQDVVTDMMPFWPSGKRTDDEQYELMTKFCALTGREQTELRKWLKRYYAPSPNANLVTTDANGPLSEREARIYMTDQQLKEKTPKLDEATTGYARARGLLARAV